MISVPKQRDKLVWAPVRIYLDLKNNQATNQKQKRGNTELTSTLEPKKWELKDSFLVLLGVKIITIINPF